MGKKRTKRVLLLVFVIVCLYTIPVMATSRSFSFTLPASKDYFGGLKYTASYTRDSSLPRANVKTDYATISTMYYLAHSSDRSANCTDVLYFTNPATKYFTWKSGQGGAGNSYCLCVCTNASAHSSWGEYQVKGTFVE